MKEVTAEKWDYKPRIMKVWDDSSDPKKIMYVLSILQSDKKHPVNAPVVAVGKSGWPVFFRHCAELKGAKEPETEKHHRSYSSAEEYIADSKKRFFSGQDVFVVWIKNIASGHRCLVTGIEEHGLSVDGCYIDYETLLRNYTYEDGSVCGKEIKDYEFGLCSCCRGCGYTYGQDKPCQHLVDAKHGFKDGYEKGCRFLEQCKNNELWEMKKKTFEEWKADNSREIEDLADYFMRHDTEDYFVHDKYLEAYEKIELLCKLAFDRE